VVVVGSIDRRDPLACRGAPVRARPRDDQPMARWPISDESARAMYAGGRADDTARWYARWWGRVFALGLFPRRWVTLEVPGRVTGEVRSVPLGMADHGGRWYLVSMLGECNWVRNARANDGRVVLRRRHRVRCRLVEVPPAERAPILRRYVDKVPGGRPHVQVAKGAPLAEFASIADCHPVFAVLRDSPAGTVPWSTRRFPVRR
jgi:deazaflavin-dependent oxidoreductase (nitroreductase family)